MRYSRLNRLPLSNTSIIVVLIVFFLSVVGYIANIVKLVGTDLVIAEYTIIELLRILGIIAPPFGVIMGFI